jgi:hypothetical protein
VLFETDIGLASQANDRGEDEKVPWEAFDRLDFELDSDPLAIDSMNFDSF